MNNSTKDKISKCKTFDELLDAEYGKKGTAIRDIFETGASMFSQTQILKESFRKSNDKPHLGIDITEQHYKVSLQRLEKLLLLVNTHQGEQNLLYT